MGARAGAVVDAGAQAGSSGKGAAGAGRVPGTQPRLASAGFARRARGRAPPAPAWPPAGRAPPRPLPATVVAPAATLRPVSLRRMHRIRADQGIYPLLRSDPRFVGSLRFRLAVKAKEGSK